MSSRIGWRGLVFAKHCSEGVRISDQLSKQALLLELRKEHLAVGCAVRCDFNIHLFDTKKLVGKQRTAEGIFASKSRCLGPVD